MQKDSPADFPNTNVGDAANSTHFLEVRKQKLQDMRDRGFDPFRANWEQSHTSADVRSAELKDDAPAQMVSVAGRILAIRLMGQAAFVKILDRDGQVQLYIKSDVAGSEHYQEFKKYDLGDIIGAKGPLFRTKTGEITVHVESFQLLAKSLQPLPKEWYGLAESDTIYRQRYLDLIVNQDSRKRFLMRSRIVQEIRNFL